MLGHSTRLSDRLCLLSTDFLFVGGCLPTRLHIRLVHTLLHLVLPRVLPKFWHRSLHIFINLRGIHQVDLVLTIAVVLSPKYFRLLRWLQTLALRNESTQRLALGHLFQVLNEFVVEVSFGVLVQLLVLLKQSLLGCYFYLDVCGLSAGAHLRLHIAVHTYFLGDLRPRLVRRHRLNFIDYLLPWVDFVNHREKGGQFGLVPGCRPQLRDQVFSLLGRQNC